MNNVMSIEELKREVKAHHYASMYQLALEYLSGQRVSHDEKKAYHLLKECVSNNYTPSFGPYANCLDEGIGCVPNMEEAFKAYLKAAEAGDEECYGIVAMRYIDGIGTEPNPQEALNWAHKGALCQDVSSLLLLSELDKNNAKEYLSQVLAVTQPGDGYYEEASLAIKHLK